MMRLRTASTGGRRNTGTTYSPRQHVDFAGVKSPPLLILWKDEAARAGHQPRVSDGKNLMSNMDTRGSVILGVCRQDPERWAQFDAIYRSMLFAFMRRRGLPESEADDVVQEIFVKLLVKIQTYDRTKYKFRSWLFSVAQNSLIDRARRRASHQKALAGWVVNVLQSTPSDSVKIAEEWLKIHRTKILAHAANGNSRTCRPGCLAPRVWTCFEQRLLRDRPGAEIARELGLEPGTVFVNASRVLTKVRAVCLEFDEDLTDVDDADLSGRD